MGVSDCLTSQFHGIFKGLELLDKLNLKGAILETDCQPAYEWITRDGDWRRAKREIIHVWWPIIMKCRELVDKNAVLFNLILRDDGNKCAEKLADMAIDRKVEHLEIKDVPWKLRYLVEQDAKSVGSSR